MVHLLAGSAWLGGLLWLIQIFRRENGVFSVEARRVSSVALWAVIAILFSGVIQTRFFLSSWGDFIHSGYGQLVLIKMSGVAILIGYGVYNRFRLLPRIDESQAGPGLSRSVRQEIVIIIVLITIGGFLAYVPTPSAPHAEAASNTATGGQPSVHSCRCLKDAGIVREERMAGGCTTTSTGTHSKKWSRSSPG